jgi:hypothetical protein
VHPVVQEPPLIERQGLLVDLSSSSIEFSALRGPSLEEPALLLPNEEALPVRGMHELPTGIHGVADFAIVEIEFVI